MTKRKDGYYMARFTTETGNIKYVYAKTQKECATKLVKAKEDIAIQIETSTMNPKMPLNKAIDYYIDNFCNYRNSTLKIKRNAIDSAKGNKAMEKAICKITYEDIKGILENIKTLQNRKTLYYILKDVLGKFKDIGMIKYNYVEMVSPKLIGTDTANKIVDINAEPKHKYYNQEQVDSIIHNALDCDLELGLLLQVLFYSGMRIGEAIGLTWNNVDFKNKTITISQQFNQTTQEITTTKSKSSNRVIPMFDKCRDALESLKELNGERLTVFSRQVANYNYILDKNKLAICKDFCFHSTRHTFATNCYKIVDERVVKEWLGHSSITMQEKYTHSTNIDTNIKKIEDYFNK